jgi:broad specificity phosphatase PhoE
MIFWAKWLLESMRLLFIRHGRTHWNDLGRLQGHRDIDLNEGGRAELAQRRIPASWRGALWYSSPLLRTTHSARLLGAGHLHTDERLMEMSWGQWEGQTLTALREELGAQMSHNEARGLDFRPTGGESPRDVRTRLQQWLSTILHDNDNVRSSGNGMKSVVVTHKGVIRAALSLATGWDMREKFKPRPDWSCAHEFALSEAGEFTLARINVSLMAAAQESPGSRSP